MITEDELYEMSNIVSADSGVDAVIFVSTKGGAQHGCRIKVSNIPGKMDINDSFTLTIPDLQIVGTCKLSTKTMNRLLAWVLLNMNTIVDHWDCKTSSKEMLNSIQHL